MCPRGRSKMGQRKVHTHARAGPWRLPLPRALVSCPGIKGPINCQTEKQIGAKVQSSLPESS